MADRVCVSIPTDDGLKVKTGHFGDGRYYFHYTYNGRRWILDRVVENPFAGEHEHGEERGKRPRIRELNKECNYIVASSFGPGGEEFMEKSGFTVVKVSPGTLLLEALRYVEGLVSCR